MAVIDLPAGDQNLWGTVRPPFERLVYVRAAWDDAWTYIPYLYPLQLRTGLTPEIDSCTLAFDFGAIKREDWAGWEEWYPLSIFGCYVLVTKWDAAVGEWPLWCGYIPHEEVTPTGDDYSIGGKQTFTAYGLEYFLKRAEIHEALTTVGWMDRVPDFNAPESSGLATIGNRSADDPPIFSHDGELWSSHDIAYYLLNTAETPMTWNLVGQTQLLDYTFEHVQQEGRSIWDVLCQVVSRQRAAGSRIIYDVDSNECYFEVFSLLAEPVSVGDLRLPAHPFQAIVNFSGQIDAQPSFTFTDTGRYDWVLVKGGPLYVCGTFSYEDGSLSEGWTLLEDAAYKTGAGSDDEKENDRARQAESVANVFVKHIVSADWDGTLDGENALPVMGTDSYLYPDEMATAWAYKWHFERQLPFEEGDGTALTPEYRAAFVLAPDPNDLSKYIYVDREFVDDNDDVVRPAEIRVSDTELAVFVRGSFNHLFGLNDFDATTHVSDHEPVHDYLDLYFTAMFASDERLRCLVALTDNVASETTRVKVILVPDAVAWYVVPNTIVDINPDGTPCYYEDWGPAEDNLERDDSWRLRDIAALAAAWYGQQRNAISARIVGCDMRYWPGMFVRAAVDGAGVTDVGAVISAYEVDFAANDGAAETRFNTSFTELDFAGITK